MSAFEKQVTVARRGLRGRRTDTRVLKAFGQMWGKPVAPQIDQPQGLGNTPPSTQAHDMYEGIDLTSPNMLNDMYQRYGPAMVHAAVRKHSYKALRGAAAHPDLHPRVRVLLHAAAAVRKAFEGGHPNLGGPAEYPNSTPSVSIPARPRHGQPGNPDNTYPATVGARSHSAPTAGPNQAAATQQPQTAGQASRSASAAAGQTVQHQWTYTPSTGNPVTMPQLGGRVGNGNTSAPGRANRVGQVRPGDLVHFNGPGGSAYTARVTQLTTGAVIGEFAGQTCKFPLDGITPHRVGGSDHAVDQSTPGGLTATRGGSGVGVGAKNDSSEFKPGSVAKNQRDAIYGGGQAMSARTGAAAGVHVTQPDAGTPVQPYNAQHPYSAEEGERDGAAPGNPVQGNLTAKERMLITRIVSHQPAVTAVAALKALNAGTVDEQQRAALTKALRTHGLAVPAARRAIDQVIGKLA